jgi:hypothetical protein
MPDTEHLSSAFVIFTDKQSGQYSLRYVGYLPNPELYVAATIAVVELREEIVAASMRTTRRYRR